MKTNGHEGRAIIIERKGTLDGELCATLAIGEEDTTQHEKGWNSKNPYLNRMLTFRSRSGGEILQERGEEKGNHSISKAVELVGPQISEPKRRS